MKPYNVNTTEYLNSAEFTNIVQYIDGVISTRLDALQQKYPNHIVNPRCDVNQDISYYFLAHNTPFYDKQVYTMMQQGEAGFYELNEFTFQLNCFMKNIFHRKIWAEFNESFQDAFFDQIWNDWKTNQPANEFDQHEATARRMFDQSANLLEYIQQYVFNPEYDMISVEDVREMFDAFVDHGIFISKNHDLYQVYDGVPLEKANTNVKRKFYEGQITRLDVLHCRSAYNVRYLPLLHEINTKFNVVPSGNCPEFDGLWLIQKLNGNLWCIPQYLVYYGNKK